jgi:predicted nucleic acid-binding protein
MILVDTGPLVALLHADDQNHDRCVKTLKSLEEQMVTVWPVVTEAMYLLNFSWQAQAALWEMIVTEALVILPLDREDAPRMKDLMRKYRDLPMDMADAALVRIAERERFRHLFSLDRRGFTVYRPDKVGRFSIVP